MGNAVNQHRVSKSTDTGQSGQYDAMSSFISSQMFCRSGDVMGVNACRLLGRHEPRPDRSRQFTAKAPPAPPGIGTGRSMAILVLPWLTSDFRSFLRASPYLPAPPAHLETGQTPHQHLLLSDYFFAAADNKYLCAPRLVCRCLPHAEPQCTHTHSRPIPTLRAHRWVGYTKAPRATPRRISSVTIDLHWHRAGTCQPWEPPCWIWTPTHALDFQRLS